SKCIASHRIECNIDATSKRFDSRNHILATRVDQVIRAMPLCEVELFGRACCRNYSRPERFADFDGSNSHAARGAGDKQNLIWLKSGSMFETYVSGPIRNRKRRSLQEIHFRRHLEN